MVAYKLLCEIHGGRVMPAFNRFPSAPAMEGGCLPKLKANYQDIGQEV